MANTKDIISGKTIDLSLPNKKLHNNKRKDTHFVCCVFTGNVQKNYRVKFDQCTFENCRIDFECHDYVENQSYNFNCCAFLNCIFSVKSMLCVNTCSFEKCTFSGECNVARSRMSYCTFTLCDFDDVYGQLMYLLCCSIFESVFSRCNLMKSTILNCVYGNNTVVESPGISMACPEKGSFYGYKKVMLPNCYRDRWGIAKLYIPKDAKRSSATTNKCRCDRAYVADIYNPDTGDHLDEAYSVRDGGFVYKRNSMVIVPDFDDNRWEECATGIHFFMTEEEAIDYLFF